MGRELQLPSMSYLTEKRSCQKRLLTLLNTTQQIRQSIRTRRQRKRQDAEQQQNAQNNEQTGSTGTLASSTVAAADSLVAPTSQIQDLRGETSQQQPTSEQMDVDQSSKDSIKSIIL